jgi:hypothetical protein
MLLAVQINVYPLLLPLTTLDFRDNQELDGIQPLLPKASSRKESWIVIVMRYQQIKEVSV